ncbi:MAG: hydroxyisourate hydrolase [Bacteroides sp.]|nr:hydroxyisourate hydrolase [Bacteroides sp.]
MKKILFLFVFTMLVCTHTLTAQSTTDYRLSTHILDINQGKPASGVTITLYQWDPEKEVFEEVASGKTDENGRIGNFLPSTSSNEGMYKLKFETLAYFNNQQIASIYPYIEVVFRIEGKGHYHIPITLSANGYSTYRGN